MPEVEERLTLADDASVICAEVLARHFKTESRYQHNRASALVSNIADQIVQRLTQEAKLPRKYIAHVTVMEKNGSGLYMISSCSWNSTSDACYVHKEENNSMWCIVTVYGVTM